MRGLRRGAKVGIIGLMCTALAACSSIDNVNGVSLNSRVENPCSEYPIVCIVGIGFIAGGAALIVASNSNKSSTSSAPIASDQRLKRDIKLVQKLENGVHLYAFRYLGDERTFVGVLAQDLLQMPRFKSAVHTSANGYYAVDYSQLGLQLFGADQMKDAGERAARRRS